MTITKKTTEIKPCPFCGCKEIGVFSLGRNGNKGVELCCHDCGGRSYRGLDYQAAKGQWNSRAASN